METLQSSAYNVYHPATLYARIPLQFPITVPRKIVFFNCYFLRTVLT